MEKYNQNIPNQLVQDNNSNSNKTVHKLIDEINFF